jgi:hypothetical protein
MAVAKTDQWRRELAINKLLNGDAWPGPQD